MARREFSEKELIDLTMAVIAINGRNRLAVSFAQWPERISRRRRTEGPRRSRNDHIETSL